MGGGRVEITTTTTTIIIIILIIMIIIIMIIIIMIIRFLKLSTLGWAERISSLSSIKYPNSERL